MLKRLLLLLPVLLLAACTASPVKEVSQVLDLSLPEGDVITDLDTHGGFHGDGESCIVLAFAPENGEALAAELAGRTDWQALPLDDLPTTVMESIIPLLEDDGLDYTVPTQGWYWYQDRSPAGHSREFPLNCTIAIYDPQSCQLAYFELDT